MEDVDDRVRAAMKALDDRAPAATHDHDLAAKVEARLARLGDDMESTSTEGTHGRDAADGVPPKIDDSGLHDIKALAKTTRQRVSRRITSQHDIDEQLLSSSSSGLHMVALPEPAKVVSLPSIDEIAAAPETPGAVARAAHKVARAEHAPRRRAVWIGGAVVAAAAAVIGVVVIKGNDKNADTARSEQVAGRSAGSGSAMAAVAPPRQEVAGAPTPPETKQADHETVVANTAVDTQAPGAGSASGSAAGSGSAAAFENTPTTTGAVDAHHAKTTPTNTKEHTIGNGAGNGSAKVDLKKDGKTVKGGGKPAPGGSGKSLDDLIDEAAGGSGADTKKPTSDVKPTLDKKELTSGDIRTAMGSVTKRAAACYDKFNQAGTVGVKASVAPSGKITKVTITGAFAGTPTGDCVASVVQGVSFPAWDGAPMTVNYSYLLSE